MDREVQEQHCQCLVEVGLHPLAIGQDRSKPATRRVADGERMNPSGRVARSRRYRGDEEHQGDQQPENRHAGARAPVPPVYGSGRPAFSPPTVLRGRGRIFPAPARGTSTLS